MAGEDILDYFVLGFMNLRNMSIVMICDDVSDIESFEDSDIIKPSKKNNVTFSRSMASAFFIVFE